MATGGAEGRELGRTAFGPGRTSSQRLTIARAADAASGRAFSVEDLAEAVRATDPGIGIATVYRAVGAMEATGFIEQLGTHNGAALYARCATGAHHHHLLCTSCNAVADVECPVVGAPSDERGFRVTGHRLVLYGLCGACGAQTDRDGEAGAAREADCCGGAGDAS